MEKLPTPIWEASLHGQFPTEGTDMAQRSTVHHVIPVYSGVNTLTLPNSTVLLQRLAWIHVQAPTKAWNIYNSSLCGNTVITHDHQHTDYRHILQYK